MFLITLPRETVHGPLALLNTSMVIRGQKRKFFCATSPMWRSSVSTNKCMLCCCGAYFCHQYFNWESYYDWEELHETYASCPSERNTTMQQLFLHIITFVHLFVILLRTDICFGTSLFCMNVWYTCLQISLSYYDFFFYRSLPSKVHHFSYNKNFTATEYKYCIYESSTV